MGFSESQQKLINYPGLLSCCYEFSKKLLHEEIEYFEKQEKYRTVVDELKEIEKQNSPQAPVIRIGKGQGYLSVTINMLIKEKDPDLYKDVVVHATKGTSYSLEFPKTRRIVAINQKDKTRYYPLGWLKLTLE